MSRRRCVRSAGVRASAKFSARRLGLACGLVACSPGPSQAPAGADGRGEVAGATASPVVASAGAAEACADAACWTRLADEAAALGSDDVAAGLRGQAFRGEPTRARLAAWIDALVAGGELRRAREGLAEARALGERRGDRGLVADVEARLRRLPAAREGPIAAPSLTPEQRAAYAAEAAGRPGEAASALAAAHAGEPVHLARAGSLQARRGERAAARRLWAAARAGLYERGADTRIEAVETWFTTTFGWSGDEMAVMRLYSSLETLQDQVGALELFAPTRAGVSAGRTFYFARPSHVLAFGGDGFVRDEEGALVLTDLLSGTQARAQARPGGRVTQVVTSGAGDDLLVLAIGEDGAGLFDAKGERLTRFALSGTTPTITRVYFDAGEHDNILEDSPTWPVALAMTDGAGLVAVGGSDSKVRVFERSGRPLALLAFEWKYSERRHMGGNPDQNVPLSLRFDADERLVAVYTRGDIYVWDPRTGKPVQHHSGRCTPEEGAARRALHKNPGEPSEEDLLACGHATVGHISPDATTVVTGGALSGFRVRSVADGRTRYFAAGNALPDRALALSGRGAVGMVDLYGAAAVWRPGAAEAEVLRPASDAGPVTPTLSRDGRILRSSSVKREVFWDLATRRQLPVTRDGERLLAVSEDMRWAAVQRPGAVEVREVLTGEARFTREIGAVSAYALVTAGGRASIHLSDGTGKLDVILVAPDGTSTTQVMQGETPSALSEDGRWLATIEYVGGAARTRVRSLKMAGRVVHTLAGTRHLTFSRDGGRMAWFVQAGRGPQTTLRERAIEGDDLRELELSGFPEHLEYTADGAEVLALLESGRLTRWRPASGGREEHADVSLILPGAAALADDGRTLQLSGYGQLQLRRNDAGLRRVATLYALLSGGWLVISRSGAVEGSDDAVRSLVTRARQGATTLVFDGELGWDGAFVAGTLRRALAGEDTRPPVLVRPEPPPDPPLDR